MESFISDESRDRLIQENNDASGGLEVVRPISMANGYHIMRGIMGVASPDEIPIINCMLADEGIDFQFPQQ